MQIRGQHAQVILWLNRLQSSWLILDFNKISLDEIQTQIDEAIEKNIITKKESELINKYKVYKFFRTDIGKRVLKAQNVKKEQVVSSEILVNDIYINEELDERYNDEKIMLRGIVDLYFEENDEIIIVDYKTDYIDEVNKDKVVNRYKLQLEIYQRVIERVTGKKVIAKCLYFFGLDDGVYV